MESKRYMTEEHLRRVAPQPFHPPVDRSDDIVAIFRAAINEFRTGELMNCLLEGGSATIDMETRKLRLITAAQLGVVQLNRKTLAILYALARRSETEEYRPSEIAAALDEANQVLESLK